MEALYRCRVVDTETTNIDPKVAKICELGLIIFPEGPDSFAPYNWLLNPGIPIPPETSAVHHIIDADVIGSPTWEEIREPFKNTIALPPPTLPVMVAHNADYDRTALGDIGQVLWVCTYKCALRIWPDAPGFRNETLRYWLKLGDDRGRGNQQGSHSAVHDCRVTSLLLIELLKHATLDQLIEWSELPAKLPRMPIGKHFNQTWDTVPGPYLEWCLAQKDMREDVKYCAREELLRRRAHR